MTFEMGIIKVEVKVPELRQALESFKKNQAETLDRLRVELKGALSHYFNQLLNAEMTFFLGQAEQSDNKRNGFYEREFAMKGIGSLRVRMPVDRRGKFISNVLPKNQQLDPRLKEDVAVLHLAGISTRTMAMLSKRILGVELSKQSVSNSLEVIEERALAWLERPIDEDYWALFIDGTNFRMQRRNSTEKEPSLVVVGINNRNQKSILAIQPGLKDNADSWREVFSDLAKRGLKTDKVRIGVMDGLPGLENAFAERFTNAVTARCWVHAKQNCIAKTPKRLRAPLQEHLGKVMYASSANAARIAFKELKLQMGQDAQRAVLCLEKDLDSLLTHYQFDQTLWRTLKTTNPIERVNKELKRRTKSMETVGEKTLMVLVAFTALKLEFNWRKIPVDSAQIANLKTSWKDTNAVEAALDKILN